MIFKINLYKRNFLLNNDKLNLIFFIPVFYKIYKLSIQEIILENIILK